MLFRTLFVSLAVLFPMTATAQPLLDATDPQRISSLLQAEGYPMEVDTDALGDPMIRGKIEGGPFFVFFYGCEGANSCRSIQFKTAYDMRIPMPLQQANQWNADKRFVSVYLDDEGDPHLTMDVQLANGMTDENFMGNFSMWLSLQDSFEDFIDW